MINIFQPCLEKEELGALAAVFRSNWIGKGDQVKQFEQAFALSLEANPNQFTTTTSCTEGIFLAGDLFEFGQLDEIIVPSVSFIAVGSSVIARRSQLILCDVDSRTLNTTAAMIEEKISPRTKAVFLNHYGGIACDMDPILELCRERGIFVLEDSACAPRSLYKGKAVGTLGDMGVWSFDAMKIICTGDGGMIYLREPERMVQAKEELYLGLPERQKSGLDSSAGRTGSWWEFEINRPGRRAIMNNIAGAIGLEQMKKLPAFLKRRQEVHEYYVRELSELSWLELPPLIPADRSSSFYFFWIQTDWRTELALFLKERGVYSTFRYWPLHRVPFFDQTHIRLPGSERAAERTLNIPMHQSLSELEVERVVDAIKAFGRGRGL